MPEQTYIKADTNILSKLESMLMARKAAAEPDWAKTITNLLTLARNANESFEFDRAIDYLNTLEEIWNSKGLPEFSLELRVELHREKGKALASQGKLDEAIQEYQKILNFCRDAGQLRVKSETFTQIGQLMAKMGDHDRALGYLQRAIGAYRRLDDQRGMCKALRNLGVIYVELGEFEEAESTYDEAIAVAQDIGDDLVYADLVNNLGTIMNMRGKWQKALELYHESLHIYEENGEIRKTAYTRNNVAITLTEQGKDSEAFSWFQEAYEIAVSIKDEALTLIVDINLADLNLKKGELVDAKRHCRRAEQYLIKTNRSNSTLVETKKTAGKIAYHERDYDSALSYLTEALDLSRNIGAQFLEAEVLLERGKLLMAMERHLDSLTDLESSYHIYTGLKADGKREQTEEVINSLEALYLDIFNSMAQRVDRKDPYTKGHSDRVASLSMLLAKELGLRGNMLKTIVAAALLHDVGKIHIDNVILKKAGKLTDREFQAIQKHPEFGVELLRGKEFPWDIKPLVLHHHEKMNGQGYPLGLKGEDIPLGARIICIADVFDALTSDRVYRAAFDIEKALDIMEKESGTSFDPVLLKCFVNIIHQGKADPVINSRTREDELYSIWSQCTIEDNNPANFEPAVTIK